MNLLGLAAILLAPQSADWEAQALQLEFDRFYDQAVIARIEAVRAAESPEDAKQHRRELTRQLQWYDGLVATVRETGLSWSIAGGRVAVLDDEELWVYDADSGRRLLEPIPMKEASQITLSADGLRAVVWAYQRGTLHVIDLESAKPVFKEAIDYYSGHAISPDGQTLAVYTFDGTSPGLTCIRLADGERTQFPPEVHKDCSLDRFEFSPDGKSLICTWGDFVIFDVEAGTATRVHEAPDFEDDYAPDLPYLREWIDGGLRIAEVDSARGLCIWNCAEGDWEIEGLFAGHYPKDIGFDRATREVTVVDANGVYRAAMETGESAGQPLVLDDAVGFGDLSMEYNDPVCSDDGRLVAAPGDQRRIRVWETASGRKLAREHRHSGVRTWDPWIEFIAPRRFAVELPGQMIRIWDAGDELKDHVEVPSTSMHMAHRRGATERCAVVRWLDRAFVYSSDAPPREIRLPDGEYSGLSVDGAGERAFFSGDHFGIWSASLLDPAEPARLVSQKSRYGGVRVNSEGSHLLLRDETSYDVISTSTGLTVARYGSVDGWPHIIDSEGDLRVFIDGEWHLLDGDAAAKSQMSSFDYDLENRGEEPITLTPFSGAGTLTIGPSHDDGRAKATWAPRIGRPIEFMVSQGNGNDRLLTQFVEGSHGNRYFEFEEKAEALRIHELPTGKEWRIPCPKGMPDHVVAQGDRLLVASEAEVTLYRMSDRAKLLQAPIPPGTRQIELIPGKDAFIALAGEYCIDGLNAITGERVAPRWWSNGQSPRLIWDDGATVILGTQAGQVLEYSYKDGSVRSIPDGYGAGLGEVTLSSDASLLAFSTEEGEFVLYDRSTQETLFEGLPRDLLNVSLGKGLVPDIDWIRMDEDANVVVVLARDMRPEKDYSHPARTFVALFDVRSGEPIRCFEIETSNFPDVIWTNDFSRLAAVGYKVIEIFDIKKGTRTHYIPLPHSVDLAGFDPTGSSIALCRDASHHDDDRKPLPGKLSIFDLGNRRFTSLDAPGHSRAWGPRFASGAWAIEYPQEDDSIHEVDLATGKIDKTAGERPFRNSPNGSTLVTGWHTRATVQDGVTVPGPSRRGSHRSSGMRFYGSSSNRFLNADKTLALAGAVVNSDGLAFEVLDFRPSQLLPTEGTVDALSKEWSRRLALKVEQGKILPTK